MLLKLLLTLTEDGVKVPLVIGQYGAGFWSSAVGIRVLKINFGWGRTSATDNQYQKKKKKKQSKKNTRQGQHFNKLGSFHETWQDEESLLNCFHMNSMKMKEFEDLKCVCCCICKIRISWSNIDLCWEMDRYGLGHEALPHSPFSPHLLPTDYHFFKHLDNFLHQNTFNL